MEETHKVPQMRLNIPVDTQLKYVTVYGMIGFAVAAAGYALFNHVTRSVIKDVNQFLTDHYVEEFNRLQKGK